MIIEEIKVSAGRTFNHPFESYSNLRTDVTVRAALKKDEDPDQAIKDLQAMAERLVEDHKQGLLKSLYELREAQRLNQEIGDLEERLRRTQEDLAQLRRVRKGQILAPISDQEPELI